MMDLHKIQKPQDINQSNKQQAEDFIMYAENENYTNMNNVIYNSDGTQKTELQGKCVVKELYNGFIDGFIHDESYNQDEVINILSQHLENYDESIYNIRVAGLYNSSVQYNINNVVYYNDNAYFVINTPPIGTLPTDTNYFIKLGLKGEKGCISLGVELQGKWDNSATYKQYDMVEYNDALYVSLTSNSSLIPSENINDWCKIVDYNNSSPELNSNTPDYKTYGSLWLEII